MSQLITKGYADNSVSGPKVRLANNVALRGRNNANSADINLFKVNTSDHIEAGAILDMATFKITGLGTPTANSTDAAPTSYVDTTAVPLTTKGDLLSFSTVRGRVAVGTDGQVLTADSTQSFGVKWATPSGSGTSNFIAEALVESNITISNPGTSTFDGTTVASGHNILLTGQTTQTENGLWTFNGSSSALTRPTGWTNGSTVTPGMLIVIYDGSQFLRTVWSVNAVSAVVGTDNLLFDLHGFDAGWLPVDLLPYAGSTINLGGASKSFAGVYTDGVFDSAGINVFDTANFLVRDNSNIIVFDLIGRTLNNTGGGPAITFGSDIEVFNDIMPDAANTRVIGGASSEFAEIFSAVFSVVDTSLNHSLNIQVNAGSMSGGDITWTLPGSNSAGMLTNDGAGNLSWGSSSGTNFGQDNFTLSSGDITNQYVDLGHTALANSISFVVKGLPPLLEGIDYTVNLTGGSGGVTRITFAGDLATGQPEALVAADVVQVKYAY
jgi:hypothetical protein